MLYRLIDGYLQPCPRDVSVDGAPTGNLGDEYWAANGGKVLITAEKPGDNYSVSYVEDGNSILEVWTETPVPANVAALRAAYVNATHQFCQIAGLPVVNKLDVADVQKAVADAGVSPTALPLTQLSLQLFVLINDLRRADGEDAWDRIA